VIVGDVAVGEHHGADALTPDQVGQLLFGDDRNPLRVPGPGELRWIAAPFDVGNLRRGKGDDADGLVVAVGDVEVVEVPTCRPTMMTRRMCEAMHSLF